MKTALRRGCRRSRCHDCHMEAWPGDELDARTVEIAAAAEALLRNQAAWRHRRVETLTVLGNEQMRRAVSVDFTVPADQRERLRLSAAGESVVPLALVAKQPLVHFDLRNEEGHSLPLLTADQAAPIEREMLDAVLSGDLSRQAPDDATRAAVFGAAIPVIDAALGNGAASGAVELIEREHRLDPLSTFRFMVDSLSEKFILWVVIHGIDRRRVLKFAYDEPFVQRLRLRHFYYAPGCTEAASYHLEVAVPSELKARSTILADHATGVVLAEGRRDTDRPALYFSDDRDYTPVKPGVSIEYGAERGRFLAPAAIAASVITLLVAVPWLLADLEALAGSAGPAIGIVLSTSAVFSALVLRTDEHPLVRLILVRHRLCLLSSTLAALLAAAVLGFRADGWLLRSGWGLAAVVSAVAAGILTVVAARSPSGAAPVQP
jgi:hypothetical protein